MNVKLRLLTKQKNCLQRIRLMFIIGLFSAVGLQAQSVHEISGTVSDPKGEPLIGASVVEKGTPNGTITDVNGKFTMNVKENATLEISYIGYAEQTMDVGQTRDFNITLKEGENTLDEVVAIGYAVQKKKVTTGATVQIRGGDIAKLNTLNPLQALQGQTPGMQIISTSGQPGADMKVVVRGLGTIGNSGPLIIIDGIQGDLATLNAADIQSVDILKDAASAAIYGSQAANGVILVTTKQGAKGKGQVTFDAYYGFQNAPRKVNMLNADEYKTIMTEQAWNSGATIPDFSSMTGLANTNWIDQMFVSNAPTDNYSLGVNGGSETSVYALSLNYTSQEGIVGGSSVSNYERYGFRVNTEHKLYNGALKVGETMNFNYIKNNGIQVGNQYGNTFRGAFNTSPLSPVYSDNNLYNSPFNDTSNSPWYTGDGNPYAMMMVSNDNRNAAQRLLGSLYAELEPVKNLKFKSVLGLNYYASNYRSYTPIYRFSIYNYNEDHTTTTQSAGSNNEITWTNTASYDFKIAENHAINVLLGMEAVRYEGVTMSASNWNLLSQFDDFAHAYLDNTTGQAHLDADGNIVETRTVGGAPDYIYRRASYFGRLGYNYLEKYLFNATLRVDGSSKFAPGHYWGTFPSFSAGWVITGEDFMNSVTEAGKLNFLKLRLSWGQVGNQDISDQQFAAPINTSTGVTSSNPAAFYNFGTNLVNVPGAYPSRLSNDNIRWETSESLNAGLDAYLLNSRLGANVDFYTKTTKDWLVTAPILATAGANPPVINGGNVKNTGVELALNWKDHVGDFNYYAGINGAYNKNVVGNIPTEDGIIHGLTNMLYDNSGEFYRAQNGYPIGYFWGYKTAGIFQNQADIDAWKAAGNGILQPNVQPGDVKFVDTNHDGKIDASDKVNLGNGMPSFTYGFNFGLEYKGLDFSVNAYGAGGNKIVQSYRNYANPQANYTTAVLQRWTGEGTSNTVPRVTNTNINYGDFSDLFLQNGDFLRISNISLGYDLSKVAKWRYLSKCRVYASVQNAFTFTKYDGMDPEIGYGVENWVSGIDLGYYPRPITYLFGINLAF